VDKYCKKILGKIEIFYYSILACTRYFDPGLQLADQSLAGNAVTSDPNI
jgi:hypothetical protein